MFNVFIFLGSMFLVQQHPSRGCKKYHFVRCVFLTGVFLTFIVLQGDHCNGYTLVYQLYLEIRHVWELYCGQRCALISSFKEVPEWDDLKQRMMYKLNVHLSSSWDWVMPVLQGCTCLKKLEIMYFFYYFNMFICVFYFRLCRNIRCMMLWHFS